jgi:hypothetical protein
MYYDTISKYARMYGIDPELALAIACQERGVHSDEVDPGGGLGLYQIQVEGGWSWDNKEIKAYNFTTNQYEIYTITKDNMRNVENNIKAGMMIFQDALRRNNYDVAKALQEYNFGPSGVQNAVDTCCEEQGLNKDYFQDPNNLEWIEYRSPKYGDSKYLENVLQYLPSNTALTFLMPDGEQIVVMYKSEKELTMN